MKLPIAFLLISTLGIAQQPEGQPATQFAPQRPSQAKPANPEPVNVEIYVYSLSSRDVLQFFTDHRPFESAADAMAELNKRVVARKVEHIATVNFSIGDDEQHAQEKNGVKVEIECLAQPNFTPIRTGISYRGAYLASTEIVPGGVAHGFLGGTNQSGNGDKFLVAFSYSYKQSSLDALNRLRGQKPGAQVR